MDMSFGGFGEKSRLKVLLEHFSRIEDPRPQHRVAVAPIKGEGGTASLPSLFRFELAGPVILRPPETVQVLRPFPGNSVTVHFLRLPLR